MRTCAVLLALSGLFVGQAAAQPMRTYPGAFCQSATPNDDAVAEDGFTYRAEIRYHHPTFCPCNPDPVTGDCTTNVGGCVKVGAIDSDDTIVSVGSVSCPLIREGPTTTSAMSKYTTRTSGTQTDTAASSTTSSVPSKGGIFIRGA